MIDLLVKYPTRARPELFRRTLDLYLADPTARILISIDADDASMNNRNMIAWISSHGRCKLRLGTSRSKIEAINDGLMNEAWDMLILGADDMIPEPDYGKRIVDLYRSHFSDGDGVLHLNDGRTAKSLNTLPIMDRKYFDRFGYVYHPDYVSLFADNEFQEVSESLKRSIYIDQTIIRHEWIGSMNSHDSLNRYNESFYEQDEATFKRRREAGFPK